MPFNDGVPRFFSLWDSPKWFVQNTKLYTGCQKTVQKEIISNQKILQIEFSFYYEE